MLFPASTQVMFTYIVACLISLSAPPSLLPQDVDQLFALVKAYLRGKLSWEIPEEVVEYLREQLEPAVTAKGEVMHSVTMKGIRAFSSWLKPLQVVQT